MIKNLRVFHTRKIDPCRDLTLAQQAQKQTMCFHSLQVTLKTNRLAELNQATLTPSAAFEPTNDSPVYGCEEVIIHQDDQTRA